jgi:hypothetical protein
MADEDETLDEEERKRRTLTLSQEIAQKYSPERLSNIVVDQAGKGEHLDLGTKMEMERRLGGNFGNVRVFRGPFAESITKQHRADAVTVANTGMILMREGPRSDPKTALGKALLAHELTHVRQAQTGLQFALESGQSQGAPHEQEAEAVESQVHAEASGAGGHPQDEKAAGGDDEAKHMAAMARVFELIEDYNARQRERLGLV